MERKKIHLINELPHIYELEDMVDFCKGGYKNIYIYMEKGKTKNTF